MKNYLTLFFMLVSVCSAFGQSSCSSAQQACPNPGHTYTSNINSPSSETGPNYGCLGSQPNPDWHYIHFISGGTFSMSVSATDDVDFICWGPFTSPFGNCYNLLGNTQVPNDNMNHGCSYSGSPSETLAIGNAQAGEYYILLTTNYANLPQNISLIQNGGTAVADCSEQLFIHTTSTLICTGNTVSISGVSSPLTLSNPSYTLAPGALISVTPTFVVSPLATTTYTMYCSGVDALGNIQNAFSTLHISVMPSGFGVLPSATVTCGAQVVNFYLDGASTYTLNNGDEAINSQLQVLPAVTTVYTITGTNANGCISATSVTISVDACTGIEELEKDGAILAYPNPNNGSFTINTPAETHIKITDALGRIVFETVKPAGSFNINMLDKANGIYHVQVMQHNWLRVFKLIKQ